MKNKKFLTVDELIENIKAIIHKPLSEKDIEDLNKIFEQEAQLEIEKRKPKKIAESPEVEP